MYLRYHDLTKPEQEIIWDYADQMRMLGWEILHAQYEREREGIRLYLRNLFISINLFL